MAHFCTQLFFRTLSVLWGQMLEVVPALVVDVFRDPDLIELVAQIDPSLLTHGDIYRGLYRLAMRGVIPESVRMRPDKAFVQPAVAAAALAAGAEGDLLDLAPLKALAAEDLVEPAAFRPIFERWMRALRRGERPDSDPADAQWYQVWQLLSAEAFLRLATCS
jgi:hypothetical protein